MKKFIRGTKLFVNHLFSFWKSPSFPNVHKTAAISPNIMVFNPENLYMAENTNIDLGAVIMNTRANFIMKKHSGAAMGLMVITGNHMAVPGLFITQVKDTMKDEIDKNKECDKDVVVEEDVWLGANVTLLSGSIIGRGAIIGNGSVVRGKIPPYSVVMGNPAKIVGFKFTPEEIIEHENKLYVEEERIDIEIIKKNYEKYFVNRRNEIKHFTKL